MKISKFMIFIKKKTQMILKRFIALMRYSKTTCGPIIDETTGNWRRRYNRELYDVLKLAPALSRVKGYIGRGT